MNKSIYSLCLAVLFLGGCLPDLPTGAASADAARHIKKEKKNSATKSERYVMNIRKLKPYNEYLMGQDLEDPFVIKKFLTDEEEALIDGASSLSEAEKEVDCTDGCPDFDREKTFLEIYDLSALAFVGQMKGTKDVALIKTPNIGVVQVKKGAFLGKDYGRIVDINEGALIIQEKVLTGGAWKDRKVVLEIQ